MSDDTEKTRKLDEKYFREIAKRAKSVATDNDKTQILDPSQEEGSEDGQTSPDDARTRIFDPSKKESNKGDNSLNSTSPMNDPPTGWLVVTKGPGKGHVLTLGIGMNSIGRGDVRLPVTFNDEFISRGKSAVVVYDALNRQYFLLPGDGKTLAYMDNQPIVEKKPLSTGDSFSLGKSSFRFVALCSEEFDWESE